MIVTLDGNTVEYLIVQIASNHNKSNSSKEASLHFTGKIRSQLIVELCLILLLLDKKLLSDLISDLSLWSEEDLNTLSSSVQCRFDEKHEKVIYIESYKELSWQLEKLFKRESNLLFILPASLQKALQTSLVGYESKISYNSNSIIEIMRSAKKSKDKTPKLSLFFFEKLYERDHADIAIFTAINFLSRALQHCELTVLRVKNLGLISRSKALRVEIRGESIGKNRIDVAHRDAYELLSLLKRDCHQLVYYPTHYRPLRYIKSEYILMCRICRATPQCIFCKTSRCIGCKLDANKASGVDILCYKCMRRQYVGVKCDHCSNENSLSAFPTISGIINFLRNHGFSKINRLVEKNEKRFYVVANANVILDSVKKEDYDRFIMSYGLNPMTNTFLSSSSIRELSKPYINFIAETDKIILCKFTSKVKQLLTINISLSSIVDGLASPYIVRFNKLSELIVFARSIFSREYFPVSDVYKEEDQGEVFYELYLNLQNDFELLSVANYLLQSQNTVELTRDPVRYKHGLVDLFHRDRHGSISTIPYAKLYKRCFG
jgi:hypothetical protein